MANQKSEAFKIIEDDRNYAVNQLTVQSTDNTKDSTDAEIFAQEYLESIGEEIEQLQLAPNYRQGQRSDDGFYVINWN